MGVSQVQNIAGVYGLTAQPDWVVEEVISNEASTTISRGHGVSGVTAAIGKVQQVTTAAGQGLRLIGVAASAIAAGKQGLIVTKGQTDFAIADYASHAVGDVVSAPTATAGRLAALTVGSGTQGQAIGVILKAGATAAGSTIASLYVNKM